MKIFNIEKPKSVEVSFFSQVGFDKTYTEFIVDGAENVPPVNIEISSLTLVRIIDFLPRKLILADFLETVYPLALCSAQDYEEFEFNRASIYNRIQKLIDSEDPDLVSPLFSLELPKHLAFSKDDLEEIKSKEDYASPISSRSLVIKPKTPILPPLVRRYN